MPKYIPPSGPVRADLLVLGEGPGADEEAQGQNFVGPSGSLLRLMLRNAGFDPNAVRYMNVCRFRPPHNEIKHYIKPLPKKPKGTDYIDGFVEFQGKLVLPFVKDHHNSMLASIYESKPKVILALGGTAFWALTEHLEGIGTWMGSVIPINILGHTCILVAAQHPAAILRQYSWRFHNQQYINRAVSYLKKSYVPRKENFLIEPTYEDAECFLESLRGPLWCDIETLDHKTPNTVIECMGICTEDERVCCIPFVANRTHYWSEREEKNLVILLRKVLSENPIIGQNFFYDAQYIFNEWGVIPNVVRDTIITHHTLYPNASGGGDKKIMAGNTLDYQSSIYLSDHRQWKRGITEDRWIYNCRDCLTTKRVDEVQEYIAKEKGLESQVAEQNSLYQPALKMMLRGYNWNPSAAKRSKDQLEEEMAADQSFVDKAVGYSININSHPQLRDLFFEQLRQKEVTRKGNQSVDEAALETITKREPALKPIITHIQRFRSARVYRSTFASVEPWEDNRLRTSLNLAGTVTFRWAASQDVSGRGLNVMNIPDGNPEKNKLGESRLNMRKLIKPDSGYTLVDVDLQRADFQIVVWEAGDSLFKQMLREGVDIHTENSKLILTSRHFAKEFIHATNYLARPRTCAEQFGVTVHEADKYQKRYFSEHPGIRAWHVRVENKLKSEGVIQNVFGYQISYYDRMENSLISQAVGWIGQSSIAIVLWKGLLNIESNLPKVQVLFPVHDSLVCQVPTGELKALVPQICKNMRIPVPYDDPLTIPVEAKTSEKSWGELEPWQK